jgi:hypothetical protein
MAGRPQATLRDYLLGTTNAWQELRGLASHDSLIARLADAELWDRELCAEPEQDR